MRPTVKCECSKPSSVYYYYSRCLSCSNNKLFTQLVFSLKPVRSAIHHSMTKDRGKGRPPRRPGPRARWAPEEWKGVHDFAPLTANKPCPPPRPGRSLLYGPELFRSVSTVSKDVGPGSLCFAQSFFLSLLTSAFRSFFWPSFSVFLSPSTAFSLQKRTDWRREPTKKKKFKKRIIQWDSARR